MTAKLQIFTAKLPRNSAFRGAAKFRLFTAKDFCLCFGSLNLDPSARIPLLISLRLDHLARIPTVLGSFITDTFTRILPLGSYCWDPFTQIQCATGNPVPVDPVDFFRSGSGPVPAKYRLNRPDLTSKFRCRTWYHVTFCMFFLAFLNTIKIILENSILKYGLKSRRELPDFLGCIWVWWTMLPMWGHGEKCDQKLKSAPKTVNHNVKIGWKVTELCQLDGRTLKLVYIWPKIDYFGHIF